MKYRALFAKKCGLAGALLSTIPFLIFGLILGARYGLEAGSFITVIVLPGIDRVEMLHRLIMGGAMVGGILLSGALHVSFFYAVFWGAGYLFAGGGEPAGEDMEIQDPQEAEDPKAA